MTELGSFLPDIDMDYTPEVQAYTRELKRHARRDFTITKVERDENGFWTARLTNGATYCVTRMFGSWGTVPDDNGRWKELRPDVLEALQTKVRALEAAERRAKKDAEPASESVTLG